MFGNGVSERRSGSVAVVVPDDAAELLVTSNFADGLDLELPVENLVADSRSAVWPAGVVVSDLGSDDLVEMVGAEAGERVQAFPLQRADEGFAEGIGLGRFYTAPIES